MMAYGTCVGSWEKLRRNVIPRVVGRPLFALSGQTQLTVAYNTILDAYKGRGLDAVILLHDDLDMVDPDAEAKFLAALADPDVALAGVCGGKGDKTLAWWESETVGRQMTDSGMLDFGSRTGDVAFIEGSVMAFSPWAVENLRFDERYPGFLGYDDVCLTAREMGKRVTVADVDTHHHTTVGLKSPAIAEAWDVAEEIFQAKWHREAECPSGLLRGPESRSARRVSHVITETDRPWQCKKCGSGKWVAASLTGPVGYGGRAIKQCVPCGSYSSDPVESKDGPPTRGGSS